MGALVIYLPFFVHCHKIYEDDNDNEEGARG